MHGGAAHLARRRRWWQPRDICPSPFPPFLLSFSLFFQESASVGITGFRQKKVEVEGGGGSGCFYALPQTRDFSKLRKAGWVVGVGGAAIVAAKLFRLPLGCFAHCLARREGISGWLLLASCLSVCAGEALALRLYLGAVDNPSSSRSCRRWILPIVLKPLRKRDSLSSESSSAIHVPWTSPTYCQLEEKGSLLRT